MQRVKNRRKHVYFRPIDRCISVTVEDGHIVTMEYSYNGRLIGSRIHAFDQYQFRWPWIMLHNLVLFQDCMAVHKCMTTNTTYWTGSVDFSDGRVTIESRKFRRYTVTKDDIFFADDFEWLLVFRCYKRFHCQSELQRIQLKGLFYDVARNPLAIAKFLIRLCLYKICLLPVQNLVNLKTFDGRALDVLIAFARADLCAPRDSRLYSL